jgi:hypothetical protein
MESFFAFSKTIESGLQVALQNPYLMSILKITISLYAGQAAPKLPSIVQTLLQNTFVKVFAIMVILYLAEKDFQLAVLLSIVYVLGMNIVSGRGLFESFANFSTEYTKSGNAKLIDPRSAVYPGCENLTMADLLKVFNGDSLKLQNTVRYTYHNLLENTKAKDERDMLMKIAYSMGLPRNIAFDDENAPYIATLLMYSGFNMGGKCIAPQ